MLKRGQLLVGGLVTVIVLPGMVRGEHIVYNNTTNFTGSELDLWPFVNIIDHEVGNEVTLSGIRRAVTHFRFAMRLRAEEPIEFQVIIRFRDLNGNGFPGALLWESDLLTLNIAPGNPAFYDLTVPSVVVPNTFIWFVSIVNAPLTIENLGPAFYSPPTVGTAAWGLWRPSLGPSPWVLGDADAPFGARITAELDANAPIPAASQWGLLVMGLMITIAATLILRNRNRATLLYLFATAASVTCVSTVRAQVRIGDQIRIDNAGGTAAANETTIATSNLFPAVLVAGWNDWREGDPNNPTRDDGSRIGVGLSFDGGASWSDMVLRPPVEFQTRTEGDPMTAYDDRTGTLWVGGISFITNPGDKDAIFVARKDAGASEFGPSVVVNDGGFPDKGWMAAGMTPGNPNSTNLYVTTSQGLSRSFDMGDSWVGPDFIDQGQGLLPRVGKDGMLYIAYKGFNVNSSKLLLKRSSDGGSTFEPPILQPGFTIATLLDVSQSTTRFPGRFKVFHFAYLAVDPRNDMLFVVYHDTTNFTICENGTINCNVDLWFTKSVDQGTTWTTPVVINGDADPPGDQFFPWIEVDQQGNLHVVFLDSRHTDQDDNVEHGMFDAYYAFSNDAGTTWQEHRLTSVSFDGFDDGFDDDPAQFLGDYLGLARGECCVYPSYLSTHEGDSNIYMHKIEIEGSCCSPGGQGGCTPMFESDCQAAGGVFQCSTACTQPTGACCFSDDTCGDYPQECCEALGGTFVSEGSTCGLPGPCCLPNGSCVDGMAEECCSLQGGIWKFLGANDCASIWFCPPIFGPQPGP